MLDIKGLEYRYGRKAAPLFQGLDLVLEPGKIYGLLGRNGAGKTTLLKLMAGLLFPADGSVMYGTHKMGDRRADVLGDVFFLPETFAVPAESPRAYARMNAPFYPRFDQVAFEAGLKEFEIDPEKPVQTLSYGQQKKFMIAFGLACNCRLNLMDEPSNGLDIPSKSQFRRLVASHLDDERSFVISTHQVRDLDGLIDPIVIVESGKVVFNQDRWTIDSRLSQHSVKTAPTGRELYAEKVLDGWVVMESAQGSQSDSAGANTASTGMGSAAGSTGIDLEFLFNAVLAEPQKITQALEVCP